MAYRHALMLLALPLAAVFLFQAAGAAGQAAAPYISYRNVTVTNSVIAQAISYVNTVNESGYLIFTPNLTSAYAYLNLSVETFNTVPANAINDAMLARQGAREAYIKISSYKYYSAAVIILFTIAIGMLLRIYMAPIRKARKLRGGRSGRGGR